MGFLKFLLIVFVIYLIIKWVFPLILASLVTRAQKKIVEQMGGNYKQHTNGQSGTGARQQQKKEGEIKVQRTQAESKKVNRSVGDYVEYEEIEE